MKPPGWRWLLVLACAVGIFWLSHQPQWVIPLPSFLWTDKLLHMLEFGLFMGFVLFALRGRAQNWRWLLLALALVAGYGTLDEVHQFFVPGRFADPMDALADAMGAGLVAAGHFAWSRARVRNA